MDIAVSKTNSQIFASLRYYIVGELMNILRGRSEACFRGVPEREVPKRILEAAPLWKGKVTYDDEAIWYSEW